MFILVSLPFFSSRIAVVISSVSFFKFRWSRCRSCLCVSIALSFTGDSYTNRFILYHSVPSYAFNVLLTCSVRVHSFHSVGYCIFPPLSTPKCLCVVQEHYFLELITNHKYLNCFGFVIRWDAFSAFGPFTRCFAAGLFSDLIWFARALNDHSIFVYHFSQGFLFSANGKVAPINALLYHAIDNMIWMKSASTPKRVQKRTTMRSSQTSIATTHRKWKKTTEEEGKKKKIQRKWRFHRKSFEKKIIFIYYRASAVIATGYFMSVCSCDIYALDNNKIGWQCNDCFFRCR